MGAWGLQPREKNDEKNKTFYIATGPEGGSRVSCCSQVQ